MKRSISSDIFPALLQRFFTEYLVNQRNVSGHTISSYRDTFTILLQFIELKTGIKPVNLKLSDLNATQIVSFLDYLEQSRGNTVRSRNNRLAAIRSLLQYAATTTPSSLSSIQQVLAIPMKRHTRPVLGYLTKDQIEAIIGASDVHTWSGRRDRVLFTTMYNTGARISEIIALRQKDLTISRTTSTLLFEGKGRKQRIVPLWKSTTQHLRKWLDDLTPNIESPLFPNASGKHLTRSGVEHRLGNAIGQACIECPSLKNLKIPPHTLRHTTAMHLLLEKLPAHQINKLNQLLSNTIAGLLDDSAE